MPVSLGNQQIWDYSELATDENLLPSQKRALQKLGVDEKQALRYYRTRSLDSDRLSKSEFESLNSRHTSRKTAPRISDWTDEEAPYLTEEQLKAAEKYGVNITQARESMIEDEQQFIPLAERQGQLEKEKWIKERRNQI